MERGSWRRATRSAPNFAAPVTNKQIRPRKDLSHPIPACSAAAASLIGEEVIYLFDFSPHPPPARTRTRAFLPLPHSSPPSPAFLSPPAAEPAPHSAAHPPQLRTRLRGAGAPRGGGRGGGREGGQERGRGRATGESGCEAPPVAPRQGAEPGLGRGAGRGGWMRGAGERAGMRCGSGERARQGMAYPCPCVPLSTCSWGARRRAGFQGDSRLASRSVLSARRFAAACVRLVWIKLHVTFYGRLTLCTDSLINCPLLPSPKCSGTAGLTCRLLRATHTLRLLQGKGL